MSPSIGARVWAIGASTSDQAAQASPPRAGLFEAERFEAVASTLPGDLELVVRVGYTCGWRIDSEVLTLTRRQVDLDAGTLRLEPGTTKNRDARVAFLTPQLKIAFAE